MYVAATVAPSGLGPQDPAKKLAQWVDLLLRDMNRSRCSNSVLSIVDTNSNYIISSDRNVQQISHIFCG